MTGEPTPRPDRDASDALVVETRIVPLADGDTERRDRQLRAIVRLLRGVLARRAGRELPSQPGCDLVSDDDRQ